MSPLVRSLPALAALLAAAAAPEPKDKVAPSKSLSLKSAPFNCKEFMFGDVSLDNTVNLSPQHYFRSSNASHEVLGIPDACPKYDPYTRSKQIGESVTICNQDLRGAAPWASLSVDGHGLSHLQSVRWGCSDDCPEGVIISIVEYCVMDGVQSHSSSAS